MDLKKQQKKMQKHSEELEDRYAETLTNNQELEYKLQEAQAIAKEDALMHTMMLRDHQEQFSAFQQSAESVSRQTALTLKQMRDQYDEKEQDLQQQAQLLQNKIFMMQ